MVVIRSDKTVWFDVDDTIIKWDTQEQDVNKLVAIELDGITTYFEVISENVDALLRHKSRGHKIIVWSQGGYEWAEAVVKALQLEPMVDLVCSKPSWIYDDLNPSVWMPNPKFGADDPGKQQ